MKILIVKLNPIEVNDSSNIRTLGLAKGLLELGHQVDYLTPPYSGIQTKLENDGILNSINIIRTSNNKLYEGLVKKTIPFKDLLLNILRKIYHLFNLFDNSLKIAKNVTLSNIDKHYDIIISSSDPKSSHIAVMNLIKQGLEYEKWIQYWGDPLTIDITNKSIYPKWITKTIEQKIIEAADKIVYVSPFTFREQQKLFPQLKHKMNFLPIPYIRETIYQEANNEMFTVGYFGSYYSHVRDIIPLYKSFEYLKDDAILNLVGDTNLILEDTINVKIIPRGDITEMQKKTDLYICLLNNSGTQIPGKLYHYAATNKPILVIVDGDKQEEMISYLKSFDRYIICENNIVSICDSIKNIKKSKLSYEPSIHFKAMNISQLFIS